MMNNFLRFIRADASDIPAGTTAASAVEPHSNQDEETEKRSATSASGSEPFSLHDMEVARPKIPFEKRPESWTSVRELVYAVAGERCEKNKRVAMICRFCSRRISGSLATKEYLKRFLHYRSVGETICGSLLSV